MSRNHTLFSKTLIIVLAIVWGGVVYQVYSAMNPASDGPVTRRTISDRIPDRLVDKSYVYIQNCRDPFLSEIPKNPAKINSKKSIKPTWNPPPLKLTGIVTAADGKTVMIEGAGGNIFFLHEGDTVGGVRILKITNQDVSYLFQKKKSLWTLER